MLKGRDPLLHREQKFSLGKIRTMTGVQVLRQSSLSNVIVLIGQGRCCSLPELVLIGFLLLPVNLDLRWRKRHLLHKVQVLVPACSKMCSTFCLCFSLLNKAFLANSWHAHQTMDK